MGRKEGWHLVQNGFTAKGVIKRTSAGDRLAHKANITDLNKTAKTQNTLFQICNFLKDFEQFSTHLVNN